MNAHAEQRLGTSEQYPYQTASQFVEASKEAKEREEAEAVELATKPAERILASMNAEGHHIRRLRRMAALELRLGRSSGVVGEHHRRYHSLRGSSECPGERARAAHLAYTFAMGRSYRSVEPTSRAVPIFLAAEISKRLRDASFEGACEREDVMRWMLSPSS